MAHYLGLDLSTQQLKAIVISSSLGVINLAVVDFDADLGSYGITKGVLKNDAEQSVYAPVAMWLEAIDLVLRRLKDDGSPLHKIVGISGAGQQHGSVYWNASAEERLGSLKRESTLKDHLVGALSHPYSPNWQDASTEMECRAFDRDLGSAEKLATVTGSASTHRFTGPQIMRLRTKNAEAYNNTVRISLVSSFLASVFVGRVAELDISDVCGMNLWDLKQGRYDDKLIELAAGPKNAQELIKKLGPVPEDGGTSLGHINSYFVKKYGMNKDAKVFCSTGDNPSTILSLPLRPNDAIVSLGTSTTFLMSTSKYKPNPAYHLFNHPTTSGLYMFMLCYKNGGLAREKIRDEIQSSGESPKRSWDPFNQAATSSKPLLRESPTEPARLGLFFPLPEIIPNVRTPGTWHYTYSPPPTAKLQALETKPPATEDARTILESQLLSLRLRSQPFAEGTPPQPKRIYVVGGGSNNPAIMQTIGEVLGGSDGVFRLSVGSNACALGAAYKAVWASERDGRVDAEGTYRGESFDELIGKRWREGEAATKVHDGYTKGLWEEYGQVLPGFAAMEQDVLRLAG